MSFTISRQIETIIFRFLYVTLLFAFWLLPQNYGRWQGPTNGTLSFYWCRLSGGGTQTLPAVINYFKRFASGDAKTSSSCPLAPPCENFKKFNCSLYQHTFDKTILPRICCNSKGLVFGVHRLSLYINTVITFTPKPNINSSFWTWAVFLLHFTSNNCTFSCYIPIFNFQQTPEIFRKNTFFFSNFWRTQVPFMGPLIYMFWTSGDFPSGYQSQNLDQLVILSLKSIHAKKNLKWKRQY